MKMNQAFINLVAMTALASATLSYADATKPSTTTDVTMSPAQQKQVETVVRNYLVQNPEVIIESMQTMQQKQMDQARKTVQKTQESTPKFADALFHQGTDPVIGNPNGKVTVVEFFDYQCGHCVEMAPTIEGLLKSDSNLRVVLKEFPIRGPMSETASRAALAAKNQGKYLEMYKALMSNAQQPLTDDSIYKLAQSAGINVDKLKTDMKSDAVSQQIKGNYKLAQDLGLMGTPALFVAKTDVSKTSPAAAIVFVPGQVSQDQLQATIQKIGK